MNRQRALLIFLATLALSGVLAVAYESWIARGRREVFAAAWRNENGVVERFLLSGGDPNLRNDHDESLFQISIRAANVSLVNRMIENRADINSATQKGESFPLLEAAGAGNVEILLLLLERGANPNQANRFGETPLIRAATTGKTAIAEPLLRAGAKVNFPDKFGRTAIIVAARGGRVRMIRLLLKNGADVSAKGMGGYDAWEAAKGDKDVLSALRGR